MLIPVKIREEENMEKKYVYNEERSILVKNDFFSVQKNNILHGLELCFKKAISQNLLEQVIHAGFKWSRKNQTWYTHWDGSENALAKQFVNNLMSCYIKQQKEGLLFLEYSTNKMLHVRPTEDEFTFDWTVYNTHNKEIISTFLSNRINTLFDDTDNTTELNKAVEGAMMLSGINKLDVFILDEQEFKSKIADYEKNPVQDKTTYTILENEHIRAINNRTTQKIQLFFTNPPNEKLKHDLEFYEWVKVPNRLCWQRPNTISEIGTTIVLYDKWKAKKYFATKTGQERARITVTCENFQKHLQNICNQTSSENEIAAGAQFLMTVMPKKEREKFNQLTKELGWTTPKKTKENLVKIVRNEIILMPHTAVSADKHDYDYTYGR